MKKSFNEDVARDYGLLDAVILESFRQWMEFKRLTGEEYPALLFRDVCELFPFAYRDDLDNALQHMEDEDLISLDLIPGAIWHVKLTEKGWRVAEGKEEDPPF